MRRARPKSQSRVDVRGLWIALLAVASLLFAPLLVSPAHAHGSTPAAGCGMDAAAGGSAQPMDAGRRHHDPACSAACAVCAQLAAAREEADAPRRAAASVGVLYPALQLRLAGVEPERGTPPPR